MSAKIDHGCSLRFLQIRDFPETASPWKQSTGRSVPLFQPSSNAYPRALSGALAPGPRLTPDPGGHTPDSGRPRRGSARSGGDVGGRRAGLGCPLFCCGVGAARTPPTLPKCPGRRRTRQSAARLRTRGQPRASHEQAQPRGLPALDGPLLGAGTS